MSNKGYYASISETWDIGKDKVQGAYVFGFLVLVGKDVKAGDTGLFFLPDAVLLKDFGDSFKRGYRVKAQKFFKGTFLSEGLFIPYKLDNYVLSSTLDDVYCTTYIPKAERTPNQQPSGSKKKTRYTIEEFPKHVDTEQWRINGSNMVEMMRNQENPKAVITLKYHGTSGRTGRLVVKPELPWWKRAINAIWPMWPSEELKTVSGSRTVTFNPYTENFGNHHPNTRKEAHEYLSEYLFYGEVLYYELIGWGDDNWIMEPYDGVPYSYNTDRLSHIRDKIIPYRMTRNGKELSYTELTQFCNRVGLRSPLLMANVYNAEALNNVVEKCFHHIQTQEFENLNGGHTQEGIVIRLEMGSRVPYLLKHKTAKFYLQEGVSV